MRLPTIIATGDPLSIKVDERLFTSALGDGVVVFQDGESPSSRVSLYPEKLRPHLTANNIHPQERGYVFTKSNVIRIWANDKEVWQNPTLRPHLNWVQRLFRNICIQTRGKIKLELVDCPKLRQTIEEHRKAFSKLGLYFELPILDPCQHYNIL